jgi:hypothetical protein
MIPKCNFPGTLFCPETLMPVINKNEQATALKAICRLVL